MGAAFAMAVYTLGIVSTMLFQVGLDMVCDSSSSDLRGTFGYTCARCRALLPRW